MTQLTDIRDLVREATRFDSSDASLTDSNLTSLINRGLKAIATEHDWPWLYAETTISAVVGTRDYNFPTGATQISFVSFEDDGPFVVKQLKELQRYNDTTITGQPYMFAPVGVTSIRIAPYPDQAYTLDVGYYQDESVLSGDTNEPLLPDAYDEMLVAYVVKLVGMRIGNVEMSRSGASEYREWVSRTRDNVKVTSVLPRPTARRDWGWR